MAKDSDPKNTGPKKDKSQIMVKDSGPKNKNPKKDKKQPGGISDILKQMQEIAKYSKGQLKGQSQLIEIQTGKAERSDHYLESIDFGIEYSANILEDIEKALLNQEKDSENKQKEPLEKEKEKEENEEKEPLKIEDPETAAREAEELSKEVTASLKDLGGLFGTKHNENTLKIKEAITTANENLQSAIESGDHEKIQLAKEQLSEAKSDIQEEMDRREQEKADKKSNDLLSKTASGISVLGDKFEELGKGFRSKTGLIAKIIPIALLLLSQIDQEKFEKAFESLKDAILRIFNVVSGVVDILRGDTEEGVSKLRENMGTTAALIGGLALFFAGPIANTIRLISKGIRIFYKGLALVGKVLFGIVKIVGFKAILIGGAIAAAIYGLYKLFQYVAEKLQLDSVKDLIFIALAGLQDGLGRVANFFIDIVNGITGFISRVGNRVLRFFNIDFELPDMQIEKLATDNAERAIEESQQRRIQRELEEANRPQEEDLEPTFVAPDMTGMDLDAFSVENLDLNRSMGMMGATNNIVSAPVMSTQDNRNNVTTVIQQPSSRTSALMSNYAFSR